MLRAGVFFERGSHRLSTKGRAVIEPVLHKKREYSFGQNSVVTEKDADSSNFNSWLNTAIDKHSRNDNFLFETPKTETKKVQAPTFDSWAVPYQHVVKEQEEEMNDQEVAGEARKSFNTWKDSDMKTFIKENSPKMDT